MSRKDDIRALITEHQRRLQKRKEQQARLGINTPPEILTEIDDIEAEIQRRQTELDILEESDEEDDSNLGIPADPSASDDVKAQAQFQSVPKTGDTISANITGDISGQAAVGKNITQQEQGCAQFWKRILGS